jgi:hypothetical protein
VSKRKEGSGANTIWTVRGVAPETRAAAAVAARRSGKSVGEWVTRAIMEAITSQERTAKVPAPRIEDVLSKVVERLEALEKSQRPRGFWDWLTGRRRD